MASSIHYTHGRGAGARAVPQRLYYNPSTHKQASNNALYHITGLAAVTAALALSPCSTTTKTPTNIGGDRAKTLNVDITRSDCKLVLGRARGESRGFKLLGLLGPSPSEADAVDAMYENARQRGAQPEGATRVFANTSIEESTNYFIIFSYPVIRATGDLVKYNAPAPAKGKH